MSKSKTGWSIGKQLAAVALLIALSPAPRVSASALSDAAAALQPGQWAEFSTVGWTHSFLFWGGYSGLDFSDEMLWDPVRGEAHYIGAGHQAEKRHLVYSEATNSWSQRSLPSNLQRSHSYDHQALDAAGRRLFHYLRDPSLRIYTYNLDTQTWSATGSSPIPSYPSTTIGLEWFPELSRVLVTDTDANTYLWNPSNDQWTRIAGALAGVGEYHYIARYSAIDKVVIFGGGETGNCCSNGSSGLYRLDQNQTLTRLANAPAWMGILHSTTVADPVSGKFLVLFADNVFREFDAVKDAWRTLPSPPAGVRGSGSLVATAISNYGVTMWASHNTSNGTARIFLYKHTAGSGVVQPTITLSASPTTVASGGTASLSWSASNADACTASGAWSGSKPTSGSEAAGPLSSTSTFILRCTNTAGGSATRSVTVTVAQPTPAPTVTLNANPAQVSSGGSSVLDWTSTNATSCAASGGWSGAKPTSGSQTIGSISQTTTFALTCTGAGGSTQAARTVTVTSTPPPPMPTVTLTASATSVQSGRTVVLNWSSTGAASCTASGGWSGSRPTSGAETTPALTSAATFTLTCTGAGGAAQRSVTVDVTAAAPILTLSLNPEAVAQGQTSTITWSSSGATSCSASGAWSGTKPLNGSESTPVVPATSSFTLDCTGVGGTVTRNVTLTVTPSAPAASSEDEGGAGALDGWLLWALGGLLLLRLVPRQMRALLVLLCVVPGTHAVDITDVTIVSTSGTAQTNVPISFGHVFKRGDVTSGSGLSLRFSDGTLVPLQIDRKTAHPDGSLRHGVLSAIIPTLGANASRLAVITTGSGASGSNVALSQLLATSFDATISLSIGGTAYTASARSLLQSGTPGSWLSGPVTSEWLVSGPLRTAAGSAHPHLHARFHVRAYEGLRSVRVEAVVENDWAMEAGPTRYVYNVTIDVAGRGTQFSESNVTHYSQSRWRRIVWWGTQPAADVRHNSLYLQATGAVPTYDPRVNIATTALDSMASRFDVASNLMNIGYIQPYMPAAGGRTEIAPLPGFAAAYVISQDLRAKRVTVGHGVQAGAWPMHYRDKNTDLPLTLDAHPRATIVGSPKYFPACGGNCSSPYTPELAHHPSLAYVPYLITGDYYLLEELQFWGTWVVIYGPNNDGLVAWDQVRGQAWGLRTLGHAAWATPDSHPLKNYFQTRLRRNIDYFRTNWVDSNPLGYITNTGMAAWLGYPNMMATWMDDFLTWTFGHLVALGYTEAQPVLAWKSKFPVGRLTDPDMCWVLASTYWPYVADDRYLGRSGGFVRTWRDWRYNVVYGWNNEAFPQGDTNSIAGREAALFNAACGSAEMYSILGIAQNCMIGYTGAQSYSANLQPAVAVAVEAGTPNAQAAFDRLTSQACYPLNAYRTDPQWAIYPATLSSNLPSVTLSANPTTVASGGSTTLTWSATNATSCTASGAWSGSKAVSGSQSIAGITQASTFTLSCTGAGGTSAREVTVSLQTPTPAPTVTFSASPTSVVAGGSSTLTWSSTNASTCTASGGWSGTKGTSGSQVISAIATNMTFSLSCSGAGGSTSRDVSVTVQAGTPVPTVTLSASSVSVAAGASVTLNWSSTDATSCTASDGWSGTRATSGTQSVGPLNANTTYTLSCTGAGGTTVRSVTVAVASATPPPTVSLSVSNTALMSGGSVVLTWSATNAASCLATGGWSGTKPMSGSEAISGITSSTSFTLSCSGAGGTREATASVSVTPPPPEDDSNSGGGSFDTALLGVLGLLWLLRRRARAVLPA